MKKIIIYLAASLVCFGAAATESTSTKTAEVVAEVEKTTQKNSAEDIDTLVTDAKLRVDSGSKSKWSSTLTFSYYGSSLKDPLDDNLPNLDNDPNPAPVKAALSLGARYRFEPGESLMLATGVSQPKPFAGDEAGEAEVQSPMFHYNVTTKVQDIQVGSTLTGIYSTNEYLKKIGQVGMLGYSINALGNPAQSRFHAGIMASFYGAYFDKNESYLAAMQSNYGYAFSPMVKYQVGNAFSLYTSVQIADYYHTRAMNEWDFERKPVTQNVGAGIAVRRDIYLSPHIIFRTTDIASSKTSVNLSATINMF